MTEFYGKYKKRSYFEGWYFKNQNERDTISFIPAFHVDQNQNKSASIQVITNNSSYYLTYPIDEFSVSDKRFGIRIGKNMFTDRGLILDIKRKNLTIKGKLSYTAFTPLKYDIMGPFRYVPFMQCRHSVFSLTHNVNGMIEMNGRSMSFYQGMGYVEGDRGTGFPSDYLWTQCNWYDRGNNIVMVSIANIPIAKFSFTGCISVIYYGGKEYRLATYLGVKIKKYNKKELWIQQGKYDLYVQLLEENAYGLMAPEKGKMIRTVHESINCKIRYRFMIQGNVVFDYTGIGSFENGARR
ncbi:tocopherol cyclase family protein [Anaerocolumna sp.]|uniref:tocopherol cyclase family protein n=1 Tax=Anaerocolumna sp. TaxID=2041569 RepID=UPI0028AAF73C|nr:tocopherol cyclase family protein [Anaerocolumna sp.]